MLTPKLPFSTEQISFEVIRESIQRVLANKPQIKKTISQLLSETVRRTKEEKEGLTPEQFAEYFKLLLEKEKNNLLLTEESRGEISDLLESLGNEEERKKLQEIKQILDYFLKLTENQSEKLIDMNLIQSSYLEQILTKINQGNNQQAVSMFISVISNALKNKKLTINQLIFLIMLVL